MKNLRHGSLCMALNYKYTKFYSPPLGPWDVKGPLLSWNISDLDRHGAQTWPSDSEWRSRPDQTPQNMEFIRIYVHMESYRSK